MTNFDDELKRTVKFISTLSPWNLERGEAAIKQLFIDVIGEDETEYSYNHVGTYDRNKLRQQLRKAIQGDDK